MAAIFRHPAILRNLECVVFEIDRIVLAVAALGVMPREGSARLRSAVRRAPPMYRPGCFENATPSPQSSVLLPQSTP